MATTEEARAKDQSCRSLCPSEEAAAGGQEEPSKRWRDRRSQVGHDNPREDPSSRTGQTGDSEAVTSQPEKTQGIKEGRGLRTEEGQGDSREAGGKRQGGSLEIWEGLQEGK